MYWGSAWATLGLTSMKVLGTLWLNLSVSLSDTVGTQSYRSWLSTFNDVLSSFLRSNCGVDLMIPTKIRECGCWEHILNSTRTEAVAYWMVGGIWRSRGGPEEVLLDS
jgi:hypothetical protein